jgi:hypothetical protein
MWKSPDKEWGNILMYLHNWWPTDNFSRAQLIRRFLSHVGPESKVKRLDKSFILSKVASYNLTVGTKGRNPREINDLFQIKDDYYGFSLCQIA